MKCLKAAAAWIALTVVFVLWSEHCYNQGAAAAAEQCEFDADFAPPDPRAHHDV
jgi:hypothetical protein